MNERLKKLRKVLDLSQEEFGKKLGVSRGVIVNMELSRAEIKPLFIEHLCSVFNVNEEWLNTGIGEMFKLKKEDVISQLTREYGLDDVDRHIIEGYLNLDPDKRGAVKEYIMSLASEFSKESASENEINEEVESYRRELEQEKSTRTSEASQDTGKDAI